MSSVSVCQCGEAELTHVHVCPSQTPAEGASVTVYAAAASEMEAVGGCYLYNGQKIQSAQLSYESDLQAELWKKSCKLVGLQVASNTRL